ncbi:unnamed protein product [Staurois parvus]|uniref:Opioid growth factor receptor (OGFr) conserved domain-containing protein n=1 Tax=Staurois parvus TaxID=386267 RepID=A0ABN9DJN2_9NEOB|nr:unnamed protein product [Staurois parvus]
MSRDPEEAWSPEYDSTWDDEEEEKTRGHKEPGSRGQPNNCRNRATRAARDLQNYRHGYVTDKRYHCYLSSHPETPNPNVDFYKGNIRFEPDGLLIKDLLKEWNKKYDILERNHCYIQWLFPLREYGMNSCAKPLTKTEMEEMKKDESIQMMFLDAYKLMLDFYGIKLENKKTGKVTLADNWENRFKNLNDHSHNNLRITRILKCLGELGFEHYQAPLVRFFLEETLCNSRLQNVKRSALDYFMFTVKNKVERQKLVHFAWEHYPQQEKFIWGPVEKLRAYQPPAENEYGSKNCQKEKNDESDEEGQKNGQLDSCKKNSEEEGLKYSDSGSENVECKRDSIKPDKKLSEECIPLKESHRKCPEEGSSRSSEAVCNNKGLFSSSGPNMNGVQILTEDVDKKSNEEERNEFSYEVSPKHDHKVPSAVGKENEGKVERQVSGNQHENFQQDNTHKEIVNTPVGTPRKRKRQNGKGTSDGGPPQSDVNSGLPKEEGEEDRVDGVNDEVKKLKLSVSSQILKEIKKWQTTYQATLLAEIPNGLMMVVV